MFLLSPRHSEHRRLLLPHASPAAGQEYPSRVPRKKKLLGDFFFFSPDIALQVLFLALKASDAAYAGQLGAGTAPCCCTSIPSSPWSPPAPFSAQQLCPQQRPLDVTVVTPMGSVALDWARSV